MSSVQWDHFTGPVGDMYHHSGVSHAAIVPAAAKLVITSGEAGLDLRTGELVRSSLEAEFHAAFDCLDAVLKSAGVAEGIQATHKIVALLLDMGDEGLMMRIWREKYPEHRPTFVTFGVARLAIEGMHLELQGEAAVLE